MNHDHHTETLDAAQTPDESSAPTDAPEAAPATDESQAETEADAPAGEATDVAEPSAEPDASPEEVAPATAAEETGAESEAPAAEAAEAAEATAEDEGSPEASSESGQAEEESGPEVSVGSEDDSEPEAAAGGVSADVSAETVSEKAAGGEAEDEEAAEDSGQEPEAEDAPQTEAAPTQESSDPQAAIVESEDPEAAARAVFGLQDKEEEEELKPEEAAAILAPAEEEEEEPEVEEEVTLEDADLVDVYEEELSEPSPYDRAGDWYVVHTYSGYEKKVKSNLETRVKSLHLEGRIHEVSIPMDDVIEFKGGKKTVVQKKVFPGYLLVRMTLDDETWGAVRNTPGVTGFVGGGAKPTPLSRKEVESILRVRPEDEAKKARPRLEFEVGDQVQVKTGPFADFNGLIDEINVDQSTLKVLVNIFGRETPVTLDFADVAKL